MKISKDFKKANVEDKCLLVPMCSEEKNLAYNLNDTAEKIYDLLDNDQNRDEIVDLLCGEYDSDASEIAEYVDEYIEKLLKIGILVDD